MLDDALTRRTALRHTATALAGATGLGLLETDDTAEGSSANATTDSPRAVRDDESRTIAPDIAVVGAHRQAGTHVVPAGDTVTLDASGTESRTPIEAYDWELDGETALGDRVQRTWDHGDQTSMITLAVTDAAGRTATTTAQIVVERPDRFNRAPTPFHHVSPARTYDDGYIVAAGDRLTFDATDSRDPGGEVTSVTWSFRYGAKQGAVVEHAFRRPGNYEVALSVTDDDDATATVPIPVHVTR